MVNEVQIENRMKAEWKVSETVCFGCWNYSYWLKYLPTTTFFFFYNLKWRFLTESHREPDFHLNLRGFTPAKLTAFNIWTQEILRQALCCQTCRPDEVGRQLRFISLPDTSWATASEVRSAPQKAQEAQASWCHHGGVGSRVGRWWHTLWDSSLLPPRAACIPQGLGWAIVSCSTIQTGLERRL